MSSSRRLAFTLHQTRDLYGKRNHRNVKLERHKRPVFREGGNVKSLTGEWEVPVQGYFKEDSSHDG